MTTKEPLPAWLGYPALKVEAVDRLTAHRDDYTLMQGEYQRLDPAAPTGFRGCALGCALPLVPYPARADPARDAWQRRIEDAYGIPQQVAALIDVLFEAVDQAECGGYAVAWFDAIPVGANLDRVVPLLVRDMLADSERGLIRRLTPNSVRYEVVRMVASLHGELIAGRTVDPGRWTDAHRGASHTLAALDKGPAWQAVAAAREASLMPLSWDGLHAQVDHYRAAAPGCNSVRWLADRLTLHLGGGEGDG